MQYNVYKKVDNGWVIDVHVGTAPREGFVLDSTGRNLTDAIAIGDNLMQNNDKRRELSLARRNQQDPTPNTGLLY